MRVCALCLWAFVANACLGYCLSLLGAFTLAASKPSTLRFRRYARCAPVSEGCFPCPWCGSSGGSMIQCRPLAFAVGLLEWRQWRDAIVKKHVRMQSPL